jgi:hypothetical protein
MAANTAVHSAWSRAKLHQIAFGWVPCRGVFSQRKRCRVRNPIVVTTDGSRVYQSGWRGSALSESDPRQRAGSRKAGRGQPLTRSCKRATSWSTSYTGLCAYDRDPRK